MHHLQRLSSRGSSTGVGSWAGCDARVRLIVALAAILAVVISTRISFGLLALGGALIAAAVSRMPLTALACRVVGPLTLAGVIFAAQAFLTGTTPVAGFDLGPWRLTVTREGLWRGALIGARILGSLSILLLSCHGMCPQEILAALRWARVPRTWIEIALLMYRYLHVLWEQAVSVIAAQKVRLGYSGLRRSLRSMGSLAGIVVLRSFDQAERSHEAMVARGYQGYLPLPGLPALPRRQVATACAGLALVATLFLLVERWPL